MFGAQLPRDLEAVCAGQVNIQYERVRLQGVRQVNGLLAIGCLPHHFDVLLAPQDIAQSLPKERVVIYDQYSNTIHYLIQTPENSLPGTKPGGSIADVLTRRKRAPNPPWRRVLVPIGLIVLLLWQTSTTCLGASDRPPCSPHPEPG